MANALFDIYKEQLLFPGTLGTSSGTAVDLQTDTIKASLIDHAVVTPAPATHTVFDDLDTAEIGTGVALTGKGNTDGAFTASATTLSSVTGSDAESIVLWKDTGTLSTSTLLVYLDTNVTGLPVTPSGGDITITWDAAGIFSL